MNVIWTYHCTLNLSIQSFYISKGPANSDANCKSAAESLTPLVSRTLRTVPAFKITAM